MICEHSHVSATTEFLFYAAPLFLLSVLNPRTINFDDDNDDDDDDDDGHMLFTVALKIVSAFKQHLKTELFHRPHTYIQTLFYQCL